jgi:hypothetical protein
MATAALAIVVANGRAQSTVAPAGPRRAAQARSSMASAESSATVSESSRGSAIRRASLGPIAGYASRISSHTALITPASAGVAYVSPDAPCASCDAAIVVALCVLMCGRNAIECAAA